MQISGTWQKKPSGAGAYVIDDPMLEHAMTLAEITEGGEIRFIPTQKLGGGFENRMSLDKFYKDHPAYQFMHLGRFPEKSQL